jgi:hypothetical protein
MTLRCWQSAARKDSPVAGLALAANRSALAVPAVDLPSIQVASLACRK